MNPQQPQPPFDPMLPPHGQQPPPPAPKQRGWFARNKVLTAVFAAVAVVGIGSAVGGTDGDGTTDSGDSEATAGGIGDAVRDGKFEFVVSKVDCGRTSVGDDLLGKQAQGQFCLVSLTVENIGDEPQTLFGDNQRLFDDRDREFSADTEAAVYLKSSQTLWEEINPGNQVSGVVVFDVPKNAQPQRLELHDSAFSGGVSITL